MNSKIQNKHLQMHVTEKITNKPRCQIPNPIQSKYELSRSVLNLQEISNEIIHPAHQQERRTKREKKNYE